MAGIRIHSSALSAALLIGHAFLAVGCSGVFKEAIVRRAGDSTVTMASRTSQLVAGECQDITFSVPDPDQERPLQFKIAVAADESSKSLKFYNDPACATQAINTFSLYKSALKMESTAQSMLPSTALYMRATRTSKAKFQISESTQTYGNAAFEIDVVASVPDHISVKAGTDQIGSVGTLLVRTLSAQIVDAFGNGVASIPIQATVNSGSGTLTHADSSTGDDGLANFTYQLGTTPGANVVRVAATGLTGLPSTIDFNETAMPGPAAGVALSGLAAANVAHCSSEALIASLVDSYGNITTATHPTSLTLGSLSAGAFYTDSGCTHAAGSTASIANGGSQTSLFFKTGSATNETATISGDGLTAGSRAISVSDTRPVSQTGTLSTNEDTTGTGTLVATDPHSLALTYSIVSTTTHGTLTLTNASTGAYSYAPAANYNGSDSFTFKANNGTDNSNVSTVAVTIAAVDDAPIITGLANRVYPIVIGSLTAGPISKELPYSIQAAASDPDGQSVSFTSCKVSTVDLNASDPSTLNNVNCSALPSRGNSGGRKTIETASFTSAGLLSWVPLDSQRGTYKFTFRAEDSGGTATEASFYVALREDVPLNASLVGFWDASVSTEATGVVSVAGAPHPTTSSMGAWLPAFGASATGSGFSTSQPWAGTGTATAPYALTFAANDSLAVNGTNAGGSFYVGGWFKADSAQPGTILSNNQGNSGMSLRVTPGSYNTIDLSIGPSKDRSFTSLMFNDLNPALFVEFDESAGGTPANSALSTLSGAVVGTGVTLGASPLILTTGHSASFSGTNSYIELPSAISQTLYNASTYSNHELFFTTTSTTPQPIFSIEENDHYYELWLNRNASGAAAAGIISMRIRNGDYDEELSFETAQAVSLSDGLPHALMVVADADYQQGWVYFDGVELSVNHLRQDLWDGPWFTAPLSLGAEVVEGSRTARFFNGQIDEFAMGNYGEGGYETYPNRYKVATGTAHYPAPVVGGLTRPPSFFFRFSESAGATTVNSTASAMHANLSTSAVLGVAGPSGHGNTALRLNGTNSFAAIGTDNDVNYLMYNDFTMSAWAKPSALPAGSGTADTEGYILSRPGFHSGISYTKDGKYRANYWNSTTGYFSVESPVYPIGEWHQVAMTVSWANHTLQLYVDGVEVPAGPATISGALRTYYNLPFYIGAGDPNNAGYSFFFTGDVDEVAFYQGGVPPVLMPALALDVVPWRCETGTISLTTWNHYGLSYDGTTAKILVNGFEECRFQPSITYSPGYDLLAGSPSASTGWQGRTALLQTFSGTAGTAPITDSQAHDLPRSTYRRFASTDLPQLTPSGLVAEYDAAFASGASPAAYYTGATKWYSIAGTVSPLSNAAFNYYWQGNGTVASPYALQWYGSNVGAPIETGALHDNFTLEAWVKPQTTHEIDAESNSSATGTAGQRYLFGSTNRGASASGAGVSIGTNGISVYEHGDGLMPPLAVVQTPIGANWVHVTVVFNDRRPTVYLNGRPVHTGLQSTRGTVYAPDEVLGHAYGSYYGAVAQMAVYNRALGSSEVYANCQENHARFGAICQPETPTTGYARSCAEAKSWGSTTDGDYSIDPDDSGSFPMLTLYCYGMNTATPVEYLTLAHSTATGEDSSNFTKYRCTDWACTGDDSLTKFTKIRIAIPQAFSNFVTVVRDDFRYATSTGSSNRASGNQAYALPGSCSGYTGDGAGVSSIDLRGLPLAISTDSYWYGNGYSAGSSQTFANARQTATILGGGWCGGAAMNTDLKLVASP